MNEQHTLPLCGSTEPQEAASYKWPLDANGHRKPVHEMTPAEQDAYAMAYFPAANRWVAALSAACDAKSRDLPGG